MADAAAIFVDSLTLVASDFHHTTWGDGPIGLSCGEVFYAVDLCTTQFLHGVKVKFYVLETITEQVGWDHVYATPHLATFQ